MTQHLPNFYEKVDDYFRREKEEHEKKEEREEEARKTSEVNAKQKIGKRSQKRQKTSKIGQLQKELDAIQMVDGLAIDSRDKRLIKSEMVKLKAEFSYNRCGQAPANAQSPRKGDSVQPAADPGPNQQLLGFAV